METMKDMLNLEIGKADRENDRVLIHFELGIFLTNSLTDVNPEVLQGIISHLASILYRTAIHCQGFKVDMKSSTSCNLNIKPTLVNLCIPKR